MEDNSTINGDEMLWEEIPIYGIKLIGKGDLEQENPEIDKTDIASEMTLTFNIKDVDFDDILKLFGLFHKKKKRRKDLYYLRKKAFSFNPRKRMINIKKYNYHNNKNNI